MEVRATGKTDDSHWKGGENPENATKVKKERKKKPKQEEGEESNILKCFDITDNMMSRVKLKNVDLMKDTDQLLMPSQVAVHPQHDYDPSLLYKPFLLPDTLHAKYVYRNSQTKDIVDPREKEDDEAFNLEQLGRLEHYSAMLETSMAEGGRDADDVYMIFMRTFKHYPADDGIATLTEMEDREERSGEMATTTDEAAADESRSMISQYSAAQIGTKMYDAHELQKLIPQLEDAIQKRDQQIRQQQGTLESHVKRIAELESEVTSLQRECDKLRSVLEQKAQNVASSPVSKSPNGSPRMDGEKHDKEVGDREYQLRQIKLDTVAMKTALSDVLTNPLGLENLGNTCFFNSVMQCLLHTHQLSFYFERFGRVTRLDLVRPPKPIMIDDVKVEIQNVSLSIPVKPTPLNDALKSFIMAFRDGRHLSPGRLFRQISKKAARFLSMDQQDAHELLRYLLDGLCSEETNRYKEAIAARVGAPRGKGRRKSATKVDPEIMRKAKAYLQLAGRPLLDAVFGMRLLQTIRCTKCHHVSERYEYLYDLSMPLTGAAAAASGRRSSGGVNPSSSSSNARVSKHQLKKAQKTAKKAKKGSRTLKSQESKTGEDEGSIEAKVEGPQLSGEENGEGSDADEERSDAGADEGESSGADSDYSYRPIEKAVDPLDLTKVLTTMKAGALPAGGGQSVAACLKEFTDEEKLEGANAYECEKCCTPVNKKNGATGAAKTRVEATKRYLIVTPPVVLTIHVKRFQHSMEGMEMTPRKVSGHVHFPLIFDIAPFCCKNVERIAPGQTSILYSLYGVVSHSGNLHGGHFVAYVKSRERIPQTEAMLEAARAVCADMQAEPSSLSSPSSSSPPPSAHATPEDAKKDVPAGQWYYCSDRKVSAISESKVLNEEAYLLFYERIY